MRFISVPNLVRRMFPSAIWRIPNSEKTIYLTFDDGPTERTPEILDLLDCYDAKATFFCVGANAQKLADLVQRITSAGHSIGNHSYSHLKGWQTKTKLYVEDVLHASQFLPTKLFRPPYGKMTWKQYHALKTKYQVVMWTHLSYDFDSKMSAEIFYERLFKEFKSGDIVVLHDNLKYFDKSKGMLETILNWTKEEGIKCEAIALKTA